MRRRSFGDLHQGSEEHVRSSPPSAGCSRHTRTVKARPMRLSKGNTTRSAASVVSSDPVTSRIPMRMPHAETAKGRQYNSQGCSCIRSDQRKYTSDTRGSLHMLSQRALTPIVTKVISAATIRITSGARPIKPILLLLVPLFLLTLALGFVLVFDVRPVFAFGFCALMGAYFVWNALRMNRDATRGGR